MSTTIFYSTSDTKDGDMEVGFAQPPRSTEFVEFKHPVTGQWHRHECGVRGWDSRPGERENATQWTFVKSS